jgi:hypothetical protein
MLTLFTTAKPFLGHSGIIQRNALQSWKLLHPDVEIILFGNDEGAADISRELGLRHEPDVARDPSGPPYMNCMFDRAQEIARHEILCYVNCDIILTSDFCKAVQRVRVAYAAFLMVGRRWDTEIVTLIDFSAPRWSDEIRQLARETSNQRDGCWIDYFCFSRNLFYKQTPAFVIGRVHWDNWLVWKALNSRVAVVDASGSVVAVHQNHGYSYHPNGQEGVWTSEPAQRNLALAGGLPHLCTIQDATTKLTRDGLKRNRRRWNDAKQRGQSLYVNFKRVLTYNLWLPAWHFCLGISRPLRTRLGLRSDHPGDSARSNHPE